jgi:hypothetical protein
MTKINKLDQHHPRKVQYMKAIRKAGRERIAKAFLTGTHSYSVALFSGAFLMVPMLFMSPSLYATPSVVPMAPPTGEPLLSDLISGKGGPEIVPVKEENGETILSLENEEITNVLSPQNKNMFPAVNFTKTSTT